MTKVKLLTLAVIGLLAINILMALWFFAQKPKGNDFPKPPGGPKMIIISRLEFDPQQVGQYEELIKQHRLMIKNLNDSIAITKKALYETLKIKDFKGQQVLIEKIASLHRDIESTHYNHFVDIRNLCKPAQMDKFNALTKDLADYFSPPRKGFRF